MLTHDPHFACAFWPKSSPFARHPAIPIFSKTRRCARSIKNEPRKQKTAAEPKFHFKSYPSFPEMQKILEKLGNFQNFANREMSSNFSFPFSAGKSNCKKKKKIKKWIDRLKNKNSRILTKPRG